MKFTINRQQVLANPTIEEAEHLLATVPKETTEIESVGGGSTMDVGKYIAWKLRLPHTAIPTTAGSGSEVTKYAVFVVNGRKKTIEDESLIPDRFYLRPELVVSCPEEITIAAGLDALCHAVESYWSPIKTEESIKYATRAITGITASLWDSYKNPENEYLRMQMLESANSAGRAINITKTSICHALSYPLTSKGLPHGIAVASTLPIFMDYFNFDNRITKTVKKIIYGFGVSKPIFTKDDILEAMESERFYNTPKKITREEAYDLLF